MAPNLLESLSCCAGRSDSRDGRPETGSSREDASCGGVERVRSLGGEGRKPPVVAARPATQQAIEDPAIAETALLAEKLLPGGEMTGWQRGWCTPDTVGRYLRGRGGSPAAAAEILAQALRWREEYREVLSGAREPRWQTDLRVLTRGQDGVPIIYGCFRHNVPATASNTQHIVDHMAAVMEAACRETRRGAAAVDNIMDCHGYRVADNLNPAPMLALMKMTNQAYRDQLRTAIVVDAPLSFSMLWRAAAPLLSEKTKSKIRFVSREEAVRLIAATSGPKAASDVDGVMVLNRGKEGCKPTSLPSEVRPSDDEEQEAQEQVGRIRRAITRQLTRAVSGVQAYRKRTLLQRLSCCRRRHVAGTGAKSL